VTILVTGATGFVGSAVVHALLAKGEAVRILARRPGDLGQAAGLPVEVTVGDLQDPASLASAVAGCTALVHVAADYRLFARDPALLYRTNVDGTRALLRAAGAAGVRRIVYTSSVATLGLHADGRPADETTPSSLADMIGHYKRSKYLAEQAVRELIEQDALPAVIVNPSTPVGPRDARPTPTGRMVLTAARGHMPAYVDTGLNIVHVDDVAEGHLLALERGRIGERYVLGGQNCALAEILATIARLVGRRPPRLRLPTAPLLPIAILADAIARWRGAGEPLLTAEAVRMAKKRMYFSSAKAERELGYRWRPAEAALRAALEWYRAEGRLR
jgi:dihydroflavonol-4-reductase